MLDAMIDSTDDREVQQVLTHYNQETEEHERRLRERLEALGADISTIREAGAIWAALLKGVGDRARDDKPGKTARDGFVTEHVDTLGPRQGLGRIRGSFGYPLSLLSALPLGAVCAKRDGRRAHQGGQLGRSERDRGKRVPARRRLQSGEVPGRT